jgi:hypothetical protein
MRHNEKSDLFKLTALILVAIALIPLVLPITMVFYTYLEEWAYALTLAR